MLRVKVSLKASVMHYMLHIKASLKKMFVSGPRMGGVFFKVSRPVL